MFTSRRLLRKLSNNPTILQSSNREVKGFAFGCRFRCLLNILYLFPSHSRSSSLSVFGSMTLFNPLAKQKPFQLFLYLLATVFLACNDVHSLSPLLAIYFIYNGVTMPKIMDIELYNRRDAERSLCMASSSVF